MSATNDEARPEPIPDDRAGDDPQPGGHQIDGALDGSLGTTAPDTAAPGTTAPDTGADPPATVLDLAVIAADLDGVEAALRRLDDGTYWSDEVTGAPIPDETLAARPVARRAG